MTCRQCGAVVRPGMAECPNCGAPLSEMNSFAPEKAPPPQQQRYIPGGGAAASSAPPPQPAQQQEQAGPAGPAGQRRPQGSLGRRLAQQSVPPSDGDVYPPQQSPRSSDAPRRGGGDNYPPRGPRQGAGADERYDRDGRDDRERRPRPDERGRGYDDDRADNSGRRRGSDGRGRGGYDDDSGGEGRGRGPGPRRSRDRGGPPLDDESEEMMARRGPPRSGPSPRRLEPPLPEWSDEYASPPADSRGGSGRRSSGPSGGSRGRGAGRYDSEGRGDGRDERDNRRFDPPGYTDEGPAARYDSGEPEGYSEEYEARPRYQEERRGPPPGARGPRSAPGPGRAGGYREDDRADYDGRDGYGRADFGRDDGYSRAGPRSGAGQREMGRAAPDRYADVPDYDDVARGYPPLQRGGQMGYDQRGGFEESSVWQPGGGFGGQAAGEQAPFGRVPGAGARTTGKPRKSILPLAFQLLVIVIVVVGLVAVVGPDVAPKLGKYLPFLRSGAQTTPPPTFATYTPGPTPTLLPSSKLYTSTAGGFIMDYPTAWAATTASGANSDVIYQFTQPNNGAIALIERAPAFDSATNDALVQAEVTGAQAQGITLTEISSAATTEGVGGEVWIRREFQATNKSGVKLHIAVLACHHLGKGFVVALISSDTGFSNDDTTTFEPMLRSFRFL